MATATLDPYIHEKWLRFLSKAPQKGAPMNLVNQS